MVFGVQGAKHDGVVSLEAHKRGTKIWFDMLSLDVRGSKQHMFLKGDKDRPLFPEIAEVLERLVVESLPVLGVSWRLCQRASTIGLDFL